MDICDFNPNIIKELDDKAAKLVKIKTRIPPRSGNALLYAPLTQGGLGLIKLADKLTAIKIMGKFRQLKGNSIAELTLKHTLLNEKQNNSVLPFLGGILVLVLTSLAALSFSSFIILGLKSHMSIAYIT